MTGPTISVVVLHYEQPDEIDQLFRVLADSMNQITEVLVVDDGSREHPLNEDHVAQALRDARLLIQPANAGAIAAMNRGLAAARGDYVHFLACDDTVLPDFYLTARELLAAHPDTGLFSSGILITDADGSIAGPQNLPLPGSTAGPVSPDEAVRTLHRRGSWFAGNATVFARQKLEAIGGFDAELEEFADAFACYVLAVRYGACFDPRELAVKADPLSGRNMSIYMDRKKSDRLLARASRHMETTFRDLFSPSFVRRFSRRWRLNQRTIALYDTNAKLAGTEPLPVLSKIRFACHYLPFACSRGLDPG